MTLCQHIIKGASYAALMLTSPPHHLGKMAVREKKKLMEKLAVFLSGLRTLSKGHNEYDVLTFVIEFESAENIHITCALLSSRYHLTSLHT